VYELWLILLFGVMCVSYCRCRDDHERQSYANQSDDRVEESDRQSKRYDLDRNDLDRNDNYV